MAALPRFIIDKPVLDFHVQYPGASVAIALTEHLAGRTVHATILLTMLALSGDRLPKRCDLMTTESSSAGPYLRP